MDSNEDVYNTICRVCLSYSNNKSMVPLVTNSCEEGLSCYGKAVTTFANIVLKLDFLPKNMCQNCLSLLKQAIIFKKKCENSHVTLMGLVNNVGACDSKVKEAVTQFVMYMQCFGDISDEDNTENDKLDSHNSETRCSVEKSELYAKGESDGLFKEIDSDDHVGYEITYRIKDTDDSTSECEENDRDHKNKVDNLLSDIEKLIQMDVVSLKEMTKETNEIKQNTQKEEKKCYRKLAVKKKDKTILHKAPKVQQRDIPCKFCNKVLANINTFKSHMQLHTGRRHVCETCGKGFSGKAELQYHQAAVHKYGRMFQCSQCDYRAPRKVDLVEHERVHTGERPFACDECGLTFRRQYHWKKHTLLHKEKTVKCMQCPRMFYQKGDMMAHYNNVHDRIYVYACQECDVTYAKTSTVRRHLTERHGIARERQGKIKRIVLGVPPKFGKK